MTVTFEQFALGAVAVVLSFAVWLLKRWLMKTDERFARLEKLVHEHDTLQKVDGVHLDTVKGMLEANQLQINQPTERIGQVAATADKCWQTLARHVKLDARLSDDN